MVVVSLPFQSNLLLLMQGQCLYVNIKIFPAAVNDGRTQSLLKNVSGSSLNASERESNCCKLQFLVPDEDWRCKPTSSLSTAPGSTALTEGHCVSVPTECGCGWSPELPPGSISGSSSLRRQCVHTLPSRAFKSSRATGTNVHVWLPCGKWRLHTSCRVLMSAGSLFFFFSPSLLASPTLSPFICVYTRRHFFKWVVKYLWGKCYEVVEKLSLREVTDQSRRRQASGAHVYPALISLF